MKQYTIEYYEHECSFIEKEVITAKTREDAYFKFMDNHGWTPYAAWVARFTTRRGDVHHFNTFPGNPY